MQEQNLGLCDMNVDVDGITLQWHVEGISA